MGAYADYAAYRAALIQPFERVAIQKNMTGSLVANRPMSTWIQGGGFPVAAGTPAAAAAPTRTTVGALGQQNGGAGQLRMLLAQIGHNNYGTDTLQALGLGMVVIADRLSHQGGLSGTVTGAQTTNLPTAALTRYTSGVGVMAALEIYIAVGATLVNPIVSYTNQAGTAGQTSQVFNFGGTTRNEISRFITIPLAAGDTGVRSVESVTLGVSTLTAGNFGVTLFKPLCMLPLVPYGTEFTGDPFLSMGGQAEEVLDDACLFFITQTNSTAQATITGMLNFAEI